MDGTQFAQLLALLYAREFEHNKEGDLVELLAPLDASTIHSTYNASLSLIQDALRSNLPLPQVEERLRADSTGGIPHPETFLRFYKSHSARMRDSLAASHVWNDTLSSLAWRVDVKTKSRKVQQDLSEPTAIVELAVKHGAMSGPTKSDASTVRFEMNKAQVVDFARQLSEIEHVLSQNSN